MFASYVETNDKSWRRGETPNIYRTWPEKTKNEPEETR